MMRLRNDTQGYGLISVLLHWGMAALIFWVFAIGAYMVLLDYYHPWYQQLPTQHRSLGIIIAILLIIRLSWRLSNPLPALLGRSWEQQIARWVHRSFYLLITAVAISGYLITTAAGQGVPVFDWFEAPATIHGWNGQEELSGMLHRWLAYGLLALSLLHSGAAMKHHFIDHDATLRRILGFAALPTTKDTRK